MNKQTTLTNYQLMSSLDALQALMMERMPATTSILIDWNAESVEKETKLIAKKQADLFREHAEWDEAADRPVISNGDVVWKSPEGRAEWEALMQMETEIEFRPVDPNAFGQASAPPMVFRLLKWMFKDESAQEQVPAAA